MSAVPRLLFADSALRQLFAPLNNFPPAPSDSSSFTPQADCGIMINLTSASSENPDTLQQHNPNEYEFMEKYVCHQQKLHVHEIYSYGRAKELCNVIITRSDPKGDVGGVRKGLFRKQGLFNNGFSFIILNVENLLILMCASASRRLS